MAKWWEKETLRFECQPDCFKCCVKPGLVYFDAGDIRNASNILGCTPGKLKSEFLEKEDSHWHLNVETDKPCPFLDCNGCAIHEAKPKQCGTYPFWRENLHSKNLWKLTAGFCPGIGKGPIIPPESIKEMLANFDF